MTPDELKHMMLNTDYSSIWENNLTVFDIESVDKNALNKFYDKQKSAFCCQFYSVKEFTIQHLFGNKQRMIDFLNAIKIALEKYNEIPKEQLEYATSFDFVKLISLLHSNANEYSGKTYVSSAHFLR